jgi:hypothetical protein
MVVPFTTAAGPASAELVPAPGGRRRAFDLQRELGGGHPPRPAGAPRSERRRRWRHCHFAAPPA